ncbi:glycosyltransferase family 4 protein [Candidatus Uhrbacteria bacterium]|nr:glycosyltransferase family 4 protein [Candidatus Uhrbacteria bacterium]
MKILVDGRPLIDVYAGGVPRVARHFLPLLFQVMPETSFEVITSGIKKPSLPFSLPPRVQHQHIFLPNKLWGAGTTINALSLTRWFQREQADVLLLPNIGFIGMPTIPYALIVHDLSFLIEPRWFTIKSRLWHKAVHAERLMKRASVLFAVSERTKRDLIERFAIPAERIMLLPLGIERVVATLDPPPFLINKRFVLCMGAGDPRKNVVCAIHAVERLRQDPEFKDVVIVVIGKKPASILNTPYSIHLEHPRDLGLQSLMNHAQAILYPSWYEGFGLPLHEAAQFGTPCIASTASALPETAPDGTVFAPPSKPHLWTEALKLILRDPGRHKTFTSIGRWSATALTIKEALKQLEKS